MLTVIPQNRISWVRVDKNQIIKDDGTWRIRYIEEDDRFFIQAGGSSLRLDLAGCEMLFGDLGIVFRRERHKGKKNK